MSLFDVSRETVFKTINRCWCQLRNYRTWWEKSSSGRNGRGATKETTWFIFVPGVLIKVWVRNANKIPFSSSQARKKTKHIFLCFFTELKTYHLSYSIWKNDAIDNTDPSSIQDGWIIFRLHAQHLLKNIKELGLPTSLVYCLLRKFCPIVQICKKVP